MRSSQKVFLSYFQEPVENIRKYYETGSAQSEERLKTGHMHCYYLGSI